MNESLIFAEALKRGTPAERAAYLDGSCGTNQSLRKQVEDLLRAGDRDDSFLEKPAGNLAATVDVPAGNWIDPKSLNQPDDKAGTLIGPYKLLQKIGEGGMGTVWMAEQQEPVRRMVAVKLVKAGMDSDKVVARFEAERQALALMDHLNIARIYDAGITGNRPYFVMELVKGTPITQYCDEHRLSPNQRLELFVSTCAAIQHAHQKGIIHRDIKPSNVLVAPYDGRPVVKVIDFGVAKATGQRLTDKTMYTEFGAIVGTLEYMSPEQAKLNNQDIDTRSDIYALGVLLYELLTGSTPLNRKSLKQQAMLEMLRMVREEEPPKPSTRLSTDDALPSISAQRQTDPAKLTKLMRGELDWIVMKSLEKDRNRRYETANGFGMDIQRYLSGDAVLACPPSTTYRFKKFLKRNKGPVLAASLVLFALLAGIAGTTIGLIEAKKQEQKALAAAREERKAKREAEDEKANAQNAAEAEKLAKLDADAKRQDAERNLAFAKKGNEILGSVFAGLDPKANYVSVAALRNALRDNLAKAVRELDGAAIGDPLEVAAMQTTLGLSLLRLGEANLAIDVFVRVLATCKEKLGADHPNTLTAMNDLATGYQALGKMDQALPLFEETLNGRTAKRGADHPDTLTAMNNLALGYQNDGKLDKALPLYEAVLKARIASLGADHPDTLTVMSNLALGYQDVGKMDKALPLFEEVLKARIAKRGADHPETYAAINNLALGYLTVGKIDKALPLFEDTLKHFKANLGADHPDTLKSMSNLALGYHSAGKPGLALLLLEEVLKLSKAKLGADHPDTLIRMNSLAAGYNSAGKPGLALPLLEEALKLTKAKVGADHPDTLSNMQNLAACYLANGKFELALPLNEETLKLRKAKLGADHPDTLKSMAHVSVGYKETGKLDLALALLEETLKLQKAKLGADHPDTLQSMAELADGYKDANKLDLALPLFVETLKLMKAKLGADHPVTIRCTAQLAAGYITARKRDLALPLYEEALKFIKAKLGTDHPETITVMANLAASYDGAGNYDLALPLFEEALALMKAKLGPDHPNTLFTLGNLGKAYSRAGQGDNATDIYIQFISRQRKRYSADSPAFGGELAKAALDLLQCRQFAAAEEMLRECLTIREKTQPDLWTTFNTQSMLGEAFLGQKKYADAEPLLLKGYEGLKAREKTIPPQGSIRITEALDRLIELYTATNKPDEAKQWQAERAKYPEELPAPKAK